MSYSLLKKKNSLKIHSNYLKILFLSFFLTSFFLTNVLAQSECTIRLQTNAKNRLGGYMLRINQQVYITNSNGEVILPNCTKQMLENIRNVITLEGYTGEPITKKNAILQRTLILTLPRNSNLPPTKAELDAIRNAQEHSQKVDEMNNKLDNMGDDLDSVKKEKATIEKVQKADKEAHTIAQQKSKEENERIEKEKKIANERLQLLMVIMLVIIVAIGIGAYMMNVIWKANKTLKKQKSEIEQKNDRIEELILNILPREVAEELSQKGTTETRYYDFTTVFFADIKGFSKLAKQVTPQQLIAELDRTFGQFDDITKKYNIERIKTIGDCYMCAGGVPNRNNTNPFDVVLASLEIQKWMEEEKQKRNGDFWEVRVGAHTGDLVAGVIGKTKFAYDIWGNTVNLASRMESVGMIGKVNISDSTYNIIKDYFDCTSRGEIEVKNMGKVSTYFVDRIKPEFSADTQGYLPNANFLSKIK